jgi:MFS family permease
VAQRLFVTSLVRDRTILYAGAFIRALGISFVSILLGLYLAKLAFDPAQAGLVIGAGLSGAAASSLLVTLAGDRLGRRRTLVVLALVGALGTCVVAVSSNLIVIAAAAFVGMLNGMGRDRGASLVLDQAILPATTSDERRTLAFAWYSVLQDVGHALGALLAGAPILLRRWLEIGDLSSLRLCIMLNAPLLLVSAGLYLSLSDAVEIRPQASPAPLSTESRRGLWKISALFGVDSLAGGFLTTSLLAFFFFQRFGASEATIAALFFGARVLNAASHLAAAWLARRIGLVNTMVFTHIPSSLLLVTVAFAPDFSVAAVLFLMREGLVEMDVPTRQSYVMAMVRPDDRTFASGVTSLVRLGGWAVAPAFAGLLMRGASLAVPLYVGAAMKICYDVLLFIAFRNRRAPEEHRDHRESGMHE